jgi:hypothetical protein
MYEIKHTVNEEFREVYVPMVRHDRNPHILIVHIVLDEIAELLADQVFGDHIIGAVLTHRGHQHVVVP